MELNVAQALKRVGEPFSFELEEAVAPVSYNERTIALTAPLRVAGTFAFDGKGFQIDAKASTVLEERCARCGEPFKSAYAFPVKERFTKSGAQTEEDVYSYLGDKLDLTQAVMDNFYLHLPLADVCRADCRGLCPVCGVNLNRETCTCQPQEGEGPFAALAALKHEQE